jgi:hypothetical protein
MSKIRFSKIVLEKNKKVGIGRGYGNTAVYVLQK